jgi:hypothetical protein
MKLYGKIKSIELALMLLCIVSKIVEKIVSQCYSLRHDKPQ